MKMTTWVVIIILLSGWFFFCIVWAIVRDLQNNPQASGKTSYTAPQQTVPPPIAPQTTYKDADGKIVMIGRPEGNSVVYRNSTGKILYVKQK